MALLKRTQTALKKRDGGGGLKRTTSKRHATPLAFVRDCNVNPLADVPEGLTAEQKFKADMNALNKGLSGGIKLQMAAFRELQRMDYHFVMCFEQGQQSIAFLRAIGYNQTEATFVDGTIVAKLLGIEIPKSTLKPKLIRHPDKTYAGLVTTLKRDYTR